MQLLRWIRADRAPVSRSLMVLLGATLLLYFLLSGSRALGIFSSLAWTSADGLSRPWTLVTYCLAWSGGPGALWTALWVGLALHYFGASLERTLGWRRYALFVGVITVAIPLALFLAAQLTPAANPIHLVSFAFPATGLLVGWAARAPEATILFWGLVPIRAKWLSLASVVFVLVSYGFGAPLRGIFAVIPLALAHFWMSGGLPLPTFGAKRTGPEESAWERRRREELERLRLKELFERSVREDEEERD